MHHKTPIVSLDVIQISSNLAKLDVAMKNIPDRFLGIAFDLNITGGAWSLQKYKSGPIFKKPSDILVLASKRDAPQSRLVFGLSYKRDAIKNKKNSKLDDGVLASFYLEVPMKGTLQFSFSENIISVYEKGRKNFAHVLWEDKSIEIKKFISRSAKDAAKFNSPPQKISGKIGQDDDLVHSSDVFLMSGASQQSTTETSYETMQANIFGAVEDFSQLYLMLGIGLVLLVIFGAVLFFIKSRKTKQ